MWRSFDSLSISLCQLFIGYCFSKDIYKKKCTPTRPPSSGQMEEGGGGGGALGVRGQMEFFSQGTCELILAVCGHSLLIDNYGHFGFFL